MKKNKHMRTDEQQFAEAVRASAQQIWQAGLGAFGKAQEESSKMFASVIKEGKQTQTRHAGDKQNNPSFANSEQEFDQRVARALDNLGLPNKKDLHALSLRLDALEQAVLALSKKSTPTAAKKSPIKLSAAVSRKKIVAIEDKVVEANKPKETPARKKATR